jgi:hypothetical protein
MEPGKTRGGRWSKRNALAIYVAAVGAAILSLGSVLAILGRGGAASVALASLGAAAMILAPLFSKIEAIAVGAHGISLSIRKEVEKQVGQASVDTLEGILPLLTSDGVDVRVAIVPPRFNGMTLRDLPYIRQNLLLSVVAVEEQKDRWLAGGMITERSLREGERLLLAGPRDVADGFVRILWEPDDALFERQRNALASRAALLKEHYLHPGPG